MSDLKEIPRGDQSQFQKIEDLLDSQNKNPPIDMKDEYSHLMLKHGERITNLINGFCKLSSKNELIHLKNNLKFDEEEKTLLRYLLEDEEDHFHTCCMPVNCQRVDDFSFCCIIPCQLLCLLGIPYCYELIHHTERRIIVIKYLLSGDSEGNDYLWDSC